MQDQNPRIGFNAAIDIIDSKLDLIEDANPAYEEKRGWAAAYAKLDAERKAKASAPKEMIQTTLPQDVKDSRKLLPEGTKKKIAVCAKQIADRHVKADLKTIPTLVWLDDALATYFARTPDTPAPLEELEE